MGEGLQSSASPTPRGQGLPPQGWSGRLQDSKSLACPSIWGMCPPEKSNGRTVADWMFPSTKEGRMSGCIEPSLYSSGIQAKRVPTWNWWVFVFCFLFSSLSLPPILEKQWDS